jgi:hypothetical protein
MNHPTPTADAFTGPQKKAIYSLVNEDGTYGTVLHAIALKAYGEEIYDVDLLELYERLEEDFGGRLTEDHQNKLAAIITAMTGDAFYEERDAFCGICSALNDGDPGFAETNQPVTAEIFWAMYEIELNRDPAPMSGAIQQTIQTAILEEADDSGEEDGDLFSYVFGFLNESRERLHKQLTEAGFNVHDLPPINSPDEIKTVTSQAQ